jgi:glycosyltransferase involved in cell wall biosynthesis
MRILYLIDHFSLGGAQTIVKGLMEYHPESRDVYAMALRKKDPEYVIRHPNVRCYPGRSKYSLRPLRYLDRMIREEKIGVVHCQLPRSILFGYLLKRKHPGIRYIIHEQGDVFDSRLYALILRWISGKADGLIACSEATRKAMEERSGMAVRKIRVLYNFVDLKRFSPDHRHTGKIETIAFAGRIIKRKGWREFVRTAAHYCSHEKLSFLMAGTGPEERLLTGMIRKTACPSIHFQGYQERMEEFYWKADLLVIPSHVEPMGMVAVEAMATGTPVLAADVPGLNEIVRNGSNGWTYPSGSVRGLIRAIENILDRDPECVRTIAERGREYSLGFSVADFWEQLHAYYQVQSQ